MRFDGDIIITDPVYITTMSDWDKCKNGGDMSLLGFENFLVTSTLCGDWICFIRSQENKTIGRVMADSGQVGIFLVNEIKKYNKGMYSMIKESNAEATIIKDFHGEINVSKDIQDNIEFCKITGIGNVMFHNVLDI